MCKLCRPCISYYQSQKGGTAIVLFCVYISIIPTVACTHVSHECGHLCTTMHRVTVQLIVLMEM